MFVNNKKSNYILHMTNAIITFNKKLQMPTSFILTY